MYDHYIGEYDFWSLKSRVSQLWYAIHDEDVDKLQESIQRAYRDGDISGSQYDNLIGELLELGISL